jgi:hypothetical protein
VNLRTPQGVTEPDDIGDGCLGTIVAVAITGATAAAGLAIWRWA